jgi:hypothetical protein
MRDLIAGLLLASLVGPALAVDAAVVIPTPDKPFVAGEKDIVRVAPEAGLNGQPELTRPAKLVTFAVRDLTAHDLHARTGRTEYAIVPSGKGTVAFELNTVGAHPKATKYEFEVK